MANTYAFISENENWLQERTLLVLNSTDNVWEQWVNQPDIEIIEDKKALGIDIVRDITMRLSRRPYQNSQTIIIVKDAHTLTPQAQNAFLKLLEEPPEYAVIILWAKDGESLLPTIQSRSFIIRDNGGVASTNTPDMHEFLALSLGGKFKFVASMKDTLQAEIFLTSLCTIYREQITSTNQRASLATIHTLLSFQALLKKNISPRMICEIAAIQTEI